MTDAVKRAIHTTSVVSAVLGAILSPIPLVDELVLFPIYSGLASRIARQREVARDQVPWRPMLRTAFNGLLARAGLNLAVSFIPGVAAAANAASAALLTELLGREFDAACANPSAAQPIGVKALAEHLRTELAAQSASAKQRWFTRAPAPPIDVVPSGG